MSDFLNDVKLAHTRMSVGSLRKNPSNYQVFSFYITLAFLFGISILLGTLITFSTEDQNLSPSATMVLVFINTTVVIVLFIAYNTYLKNIGKYVYGRMKPIQENIVKNESMSQNNTSSSQNQPRMPQQQNSQQNNSSIDEKSLQALFQKNNATSQQKNNLPDLNNQLANLLNDRSLSLS